MKSDFIISQNLSQSPNQLSLTYISLLKKWILIKVTGKDATQFLHNQLTCDIKTLDKHQYNFAAHCNASGKMISNMYVFYFNNQELGFIEPISIHTQQISEMQKYAIFSKVIIEPDYNATLIGVSGPYSKKYLNIFFKTLPNSVNTIVHSEEASLLYFNLPIERFLLIIKSKLLLINLLKQAQSSSIKYNDDHQWIALDIAAGYPYIDTKTSKRFFPQSANIDKLQGISFNKGCYLGQELITRIQHYKLNKQSLYRLVGKINFYQTNQLPVSGDNIQLKQNDHIHWKSIGTVLQSCQIEQDNVLVQAILNIAIPKDSTLCIKTNRYYFDLHLQNCKNRPFYEISI